MARVVLAQPIAQDWFGGVEELEVEAKNLFALARALEQLAPGFGEVLDEKVAVAVNSVAAGDWSAPLEAGDEVLLIPKLAGG